MVPTAETPPADLSTRRLIEGSHRVGKTVGSRPRLLPWPQVQDFLLPHGLRQQPASPQVTQSGSVSCEWTWGGPAVWGLGEVQEGTPGARRLQVEVPLAFLGGRGTCPPLGDCTRGEEPRKARRAAAPQLWAQEEGEGLWCLRPSPSPLLSIKGKAASGWGPAKREEGRSPTHPGSPLKSPMRAASRLGADFGAPRISGSKDRTPQVLRPPAPTGHKRPWKDPDIPSATRSVPLSSSDPGSHPSGKPPRW